MSKNVKGSILLGIVSIVWGFAFVAQGEAMDNVKPITFMCIRFLLGGLILIPIILISNKNKIKHDEPVKKVDRILRIAIIYCGLALCLASLVQQYGIAYYKEHDVNMGKTGFLTALYLFFVPIISFVFGKKPSIFTTIGIIVSIVGLYFLCVFRNETAFNKGDILLVICSILYAVQIMFVDNFNTYVDGLKLACGQFLFAGLLLIIPMLIFDRPSISSILDAWLPIFYAGAISCGVGYTLQIIGQKNVNPTLASLIMSFESVFAVIGSYIFGKTKKLENYEIIGCVIMFIAIVIAQIPSKQKK